MREAYIVNQSQSVVSIPLYEKKTIVVRGREIKKLVYQELHPNESFPVGVDIPPDAKKYYSQFASILVYLKFRDKPFKDPLNEPPVSTNDDSVNDLFTEDSDKEVSVDESSVAENSSSVKEEYTESELMRKRQAELIEIANGLGIEATTQDSKAEITKMILEKLAVD